MNEPADFTDNSDTRADNDKTLKLPDKDSEEFLSIEELKEILLGDKRDTLKRFSGLKTIASGGNALIISGFEKILGRETAVKILKPGHRKNRKSVERFIREARATAQIEHPNIVPIHELSILKDAGIFFTMKKVHGETLKEILKNIKRKNSRYNKDFSLTRLVEVFISICQGVAFAHTKGVIHRDLKPENIMLGGFGEVLILDWGLVKHISRNKQQDSIDSVDLEINGNGMHTVDGVISGTPLFMAPEQAEGKISLIDRKTDVYGLGAILYSILTLAESPLEDNIETSEILRNVINGNLKPIPKYSEGRKIPAELKAICEKAMATRKEDRYDTVGDLIRDLRNYQNGFPVSAYSTPAAMKLWKLALRHPVISSVTVATMILISGYSISENLITKAEYRGIKTTAVKYKAAGDKLFRESSELLRKLKATRSSTILKNKTYEESAIEEKLERAKAEMKNDYTTALLIYSGIPSKYINRPEVTTAFTEIMENRINYSFAEEEYKECKRLLAMTKIWLRKRDNKLSTPSAINLIKHTREILQGKTTLSLSTTPCKARLKLYRLKKNEKGAFSTVFMKEFKGGRASTVLKHGEYFIEVMPRSLREPFVYPFHVSRGINKIKRNIYIPRKIPEGMAYVPAGEFFMGGKASRSLRLHKMELPGFFMKTTEVTFNEYIEFWKQLKSPVNKKKYMSRIRLSRKIRNFVDAWDSKGRLIKEIPADRPVVGITENAAKAYCDWLSKKLKQICRIPTAAQWEKAARGVDARNYVWGNEYHKNFAYTLENIEARKKFGCWAPPKSFPMDVSVYGIYDLAGNVREYTSTKFPDDSPFYQIKGASSSTTKRFLFCSYSSDTPVAPSDVGFRYVTPLENECRKKSNKL